MDLQQHSKATIMAAQCLKLISPQHMHTLWHCRKSPRVSRWPASMYGQHCFLLMLSSTVTRAQLLIQPLQLNHTGVSSSCSWILTQKRARVIMSEHIYFMCVCVACAACERVFEHLNVPLSACSYSPALRFLSIPPCHDEVRRWVPDPISKA